MIHYHLYFRFNRTANSKSYPLYDLFRFCTLLSVEERDRALKHLPLQLNVSILKYLTRDVVKIIMFLQFLYVTIKYIFKPTYLRESTCKPHYI